MRSRVNHAPITFDDRLQGQITSIPGLNHGDFIIRRKDNIIAYQLAVVVDDHLQQISEVVRGIDLLDSTIMQIHLQQHLMYSSPAYMHIPLITDSRGDKLSKQTFADPVNAEQPAQTLCHLLRCLRQNPPAELHDYPINEILDWAIRHWNPKVMQNLASISPDHLQP